MERQYNLKSIDFQSMPDDVLYSIVLYMNPKDILELCKSNRIFNNKICRTDFYGIWIALYKKDIDLHVPPNPKKEYVSIMSTVDGLSVSQSLVFAAENGYHILLDDIFKRKQTTVPKPFIYNTVMDSAAEGGHIDIVKDMAERGATDWNLAMVSAAEGGHLDIVKYLVEKGATAWDEAMVGAAEGGHIDIVKYLVERGATNWDETMAYASLNGYMDIIEYMIQKGATDFDWAMRYAAEGGNMDIVEYLVEKGATNWDEAMAYAARGGNIDIVEYMVQRGATNWKLAINNAKTEKIKEEIWKLKQKY